MEQRKMPTNRSTVIDGQWEVIRIVGIYTLFSSLWIYLSDTILRQFVQEPNLLTRIAIYKGLLFILCTAALLYKLIGRYAARQRRAELELRQYYDIVDRMQVGLYVYQLEVADDDRSLRMVTANPASTESLGLTVTEVVGQRIDEIFPHLRALGIPQRFADVVRSGTGFEVESFEYQDDRLHTRYYSFKVFPIPGDCVGVLFYDCTERRLAEERLRASEERFRTLCNAAPIGIFMGDDRGGNNYSNPRWEEISGLSSAESLGYGWQRVIHPDDRARVEETFRQAVGRPGTSELEYRILTPQGKAARIRVLSNPLIDPDGTTTGYVGTVEDVTELSIARAEILKSQKLESLGVLAGGIAHDFNNILTAILGNISLARSWHDLPEALTEPLEEAERAAIHAKGLTRQLLTFARGGEPVRKIIEIPRLLKETAGFATHGSAVRAEFVLADDLLPLEADDGQLVQVFHNLVINAVQAMPAGGTVTIGARTLSVGADRTPWVEITVSDTGIGIPEEYRHRIFDPYFTTKQQGSGLGLATCYSIIRKHGGTIDVESEPGCGSTFRIRLPATFHRPLPEQVVTGAPHHGGRVLVMDDERAIRRIARAMLEQLGYSVETVADGDEALALYRTRMAEGTPFDAVILDLTVPGGNGGKETITSLLVLDPTARVIVSSGYSTDPVVSNYRDYGFHAVLGKPYRLEELSEAMGELFAGAPQDERHSGATHPSP